MVKRRSNILGLHNESRDWPAPDWTHWESTNPIQNDLALPCKEDVVGIKKSRNSMTHAGLIVSCMNVRAGLIPVSMKDCLAMLACAFFSILLVD